MRSPRPLLLLDAHYLCHRAFHAESHSRGGRLQHKGELTGVIFGFLKSLLVFQEQFQSNRLVFCFDHPRLRRKLEFPAYKANRHKPSGHGEKDEEAAALRKEFSIQVQQLRNRWLPEIGFRNVFCSLGMESDDILARIALDAPKDQEVIIITADMDLLQCLRRNVSVHSPSKNRTYTREWFVETYGLRPGKWARVKAIAGCSSDNVPGIKGVGEVTAVKYLRSRLTHETAAHKAITSGQGQKIIERNLKLVRLPHPACPYYDIQEDAVTKSGWRYVCGQLGMRSIAGQPPILIR